MNSPAYLDTCIISGLAREDLQRDEQQALMNILRRHKAGEIKLVTSQFTLDELSKIPVSHRARHEMIYNLITDVPLSNASWTDSGLSLMGVGGGSQDDSLFAKLKKILPGEEDAIHVFQAVKSNCHYFITTDRKTILKHSTKLYSLYGELMVMSPSELETLLNTPL